MLAQGYSVGRVEEMPAAAGRARGGRLLERRLVRIYSPGTAVEGLLAVSGAGGDDVNVFRGHICHHLCGAWVCGKVPACVLCCSISKDLQHLLGAIFSGCLSVAGSSQW